MVGTPFCAGAEALLRDFLYDESQRPVIGQIYGRSPKSFYQTAILLCQLGFDGIDINMGCPSKRIAHAGSGAGLIRTPKLAQEIVRATRHGVQDWLNGATVRDCPDIPPALVQVVEKRHGRLPAAFRARRPIPVSVKTRIGYDRPQVDEWIPHLLEVEPAALSIHGRTLAQGYSGESDWQEIARVAELARGTDIVVLGNGDIDSCADALRRIAAAEVDGALIGRASYGNPFVFQAQGSKLPGHLKRGDGSAKDAPDPLLGATFAECTSREQTSCGEKYGEKYGEKCDENSGEIPQQKADPYMMLEIAREHARLFEASFAHLDGYRFLPMRKHLGWYVRALPGASRLRRELTQTSSLAEAVAIIEDYLAYRRAWQS
jgi:tRNA-dihydrouridine synthase